MSWQAEIPIIVRTLINDLDQNNQNYSDERLLQVIAVAAKYVQFDISLESNYIIDVVNLNISPDPTANDDSLFISLTGLRAACIIDQSALRTKAALEGIRASLGPAQLSVAGSLAGFDLILEKGPCAAYKEFIAYWDVKEATAVRAILSPFAGNKFDPTYLQSSDLPARSTRDGFYS